MFYSSLDSPHRDESNDSKIIQIRAIFVEILQIYRFVKFKTRLTRSDPLPDPTRSFGSGKTVDPTRPDPLGALVGILAAAKDFWPIWPAKIVKRPKQPNFGQILAK